MTSLPSISGSPRSNKITSGFIEVATVETVAKVGGLALLGTLAYKAFGNYQQQQAAGGNASVVDAVKTSATGMASQASGLISGLLSGNQSQAAALPAHAATPANKELPLAIIRAMIAAAKADGHIGFSYSDLTVSEPLKVWVKDMLMVFFFLLIGLELKRETVEGFLSSKEQIILPFLAAIGGMLLPALIFLGVNL
ncbi:MAG: DUF533 domain-containing protein, partial [Alphaproteobacteria bacterium]|nr:DUF533 domain-containing protein [Alphaproteobacteria bacterium]